MLQNRVPSSIFSTFLIDNAAVLHFPFLYVLLLTPQPEPQTCHPALETLSVSLLSLLRLLNPSVCVIS